MNSNPRMRFKPPLTRADLVAIQERNPGSADVRALLWEVKHFRALALYVDQLQRSWAPCPGHRVTCWKPSARSLRMSPV